MANLSCLGQTFPRPGESVQSGAHLIFREVEDRDLVLAARKGDVEAYNRLVSRWEKRVYNYLRRLVKDREEAFDLSQDTFLKAYRRLARLEEPERFPGWLFRIAHNEACSRLRQQNKERAEEIGERGGGQPIPVAGFPVYPLELELAVERALDELSPEQRETVVLKVYQGFRFDEIAEILSCPVSTVKSRLYAAFDLLRNVLAPVDG